MQGHQEPKRNWRASRLEEMSFMPVAISDMDKPFVE